MRLNLIITLLSLFANICFGQAVKDSFYYKKIAQPGVKFIPVYGGKYKVFTQKVGSGKIKLLLLHGGPANTHEYMENFPAHLNPKDVTIYFYDQLGSYYSDQPADSTIWDVDRFVDEVEEVRKGLELQAFYILGHSWGAGLAELYAAKYPTHLKGLVLSHPNPRIRDTAKYNTAQRKYATWFLTSIRNSPGFKEVPMATDSLLKGIPLADPVQKTLLAQLLKKTRDSITRPFKYRLPGELPEPIRRNSLHVNRKDIYMRFDHQLMNYDYYSPRVKIKCPILLIGSKHDSLFPHLYPELKTEFASAKTRLYMCQNSGHFAMWDDTENYFREVKRFLSEIENESFDPEK